MAFGLLLSGFALGAAPILDLCLHAEVASVDGSGTGHQHGDHSSESGQSEDVGCSWLGPCSVPLSALQPDLDGLSIRGTLSHHPSPHPTALAPRPDTLAYLHPRANPPPATA